MRKTEFVQKPDTADFLGDSEELDEFAAQYSSDEGTNNEQDMYVDKVDAAAED